MQVTYKCSKDVNELRSMVDFPLGLKVAKAELMPDGNLEITYDLTPLYKIDLEIHRRLRDT